MSSIIDASSGIREPDFFVHSTGMTPHTSSTTETQTMLNARFCKYALDLRLG